MGTVLVTGGSGYFGEVLARMLLESGETVRILDLVPPGYGHESLEFVQGDIRDADTVRRACNGVATIYHNVAQVPLAKDRDLFWSVNFEGTRNLLSAARDAGPCKFVYTSSSAVYGVPEHNPVTEDTPPAPREDYGRAKLAGERLCLETHDEILDVTVIRPRTILGHGRLGIVQILFDWISHGQDVPVFDGGRNTYQFVHGDDLARACIAAGNRPGKAVYNIGAAKFGTMRETLEAVIRHAESRSRIKSVPMGPATALMRLADRIGLSPLGPYHALMYGRSLYFDVSRARRELGWEPRYSNAEMICECYDWYLGNRDTLGGAGRSPHRSPVRKKALSLVPALLALFPEVR